MYNFPLHSRSIHISRNVKKEILFYIIFVENNITLVDHMLHGTINTVTLGNTDKTICF